MEFYMNSNGNTVPNIKKFRTSETEPIKKGTLMMAKEGELIRSDGTFTAVGILAEDYDPNPNELNAHAGDGFVRVIISPNAVYRILPFRMTLAENGTSTTMTWPGTAPTSNNAFKNGYFRLVEKGEKSSNTDPIGTIRHVTESVGPDITLEEGGIASAGDVFDVFMPIGSSFLTVDAEDPTRCILVPGSNGTYRVVGCEPQTGYMEIVIRNNFFSA